MIETSLHPGREIDLREARFGIDLHLIKHRQIGEIVLGQSFGFLRGIAVGVYEIGDTG